MSERISMLLPGVAVHLYRSPQGLAKAFSEMDRITAEWEVRAARGECSWVCADCCVTFEHGMPDKCVHGHQKCTDIIQWNKENAR